MKPTDIIFQPDGSIRVCGKRDLLKFKIFFGNHTLQPADEKLNQWLAENPSVIVLEWQYQEPRIGDHSICIVYKENEKGF